MTAVCAVGPAPSGPPATDESRGQFGNNSQSLTRRPPIHPRARRDLCPAPLQEARQPSRRAHRRGRPRRRRYPGAPQPASPSTAEPWSCHGPRCAWRTGSSPLPSRRCSRNRRQVVVDVVAAAARPGVGVVDLPPSTHAAKAVALEVDPLPADMAARVSLAEDRAQLLLREPAHVSPFALSPRGR